MQRGGPVGYNGEKELTLSTSALGKLPYCLLKRQLPRTRSPASASVSSPLAVAFISYISSVFISSVIIKCDKFSIY